MVSVYIDGEVSTRSREDVPDGFRYCAMDDIYASADDSYRHTSGEFISSASIDNYCECGDCGDFYDPNDGDCPVCYPRVILEYHELNPRALGFYGDRGCEHRDPKTLYLGVEVEAEVIDGDENSEREAAARDVLDMLLPANVIIESDGSLDAGIEIVSAPGTLKWHQSLWPALARCNGALHAHDTETCGIHVHLSRSALTPLTIGKMQVFLSADENERFVRMIAQRGSTEYCHWRKKKLTDSESYNRYEALNLCNRDTVEMRIFRGNVRPQRILKCVEFAHALAMYCRQCSIRALDWEHFLKWVCETAQRKTYPNLHQFLVQRHYATRVTKADDARVANQ